MLTLRKRRVFFWLSVAIFLILTPFVLLYALGYRLNADFELKKTGGLYISSPVSGSEIYLNGELVKRTNLLQSGIFIQDLAPRDYQVAVASSGYLNWSKRLSVKSQLVSEAKALLIPASANASIVLKTTFREIKYSPFDPLFILIENKKNSNVLSWYYPALNQFLTNSSGTELAYKKTFMILGWRNGGVVLKLDNFLYDISFNSSDGTVSSRQISDAQSNDLIDKKYDPLSITDSRGAIQAGFDPVKKELTVRWLNDTALPYYLSKSPEIISSHMDIRNFNFFPGRRDILLLAADNGVWAMEIDGRPNRNIFPIYKGKSPDLALVPGDTGEIFALDGGLLIRISLSAK